RIPLMVSLDLAAGLGAPGGGTKLADGSSTGAVAVIYPDIGEPYRSVFAKIVAGIEERTKSHVVTFPVGANFNARDISNELRRQDVRVVIVLGRHGLNVASALEPGVGII